MPNGDCAIIHVCETDWTCPMCACVNDGMRFLENPKSPMVSRLKCNGCKRYVGISTDMKGDIVVWELKK